MNAEASSTESPPAGADPALVEDLKLRLQGAQAQATAARAEARRLMRELALSHRLLRFFFDGPPPAPPAVAAVEIVPVAAALLTSAVHFHLDACERHGAHTEISGWAFCPVEAWDGRMANVTLLFRRGATAYAAAAGRVLRPDIAANFAGHVAEAGGARGLEGTGFLCKVRHASLPAGVDLEIVLRLECVGVVCERSTGHELRV